MGAGLLKEIGLWESEAREVAVSRPGALVRAAIAGATGSVDVGRLAVLAALHLADELETYRQERGELQRRVERCVRLVETALKRPA